MEICSYSFFDEEELATIGRLLQEACLCKWLMGQGIGNDPCEGVREEDLAESKGPRLGLLFTDALIWGSSCPRAKKF